MTNEIMSMDEIVEIPQTCSWYYWNLERERECVCVCVFCQFCDVAKLVMIYWKI
jgi:hypothetical protein